MSGGRCDAAVSVGEPALVAAGSMKKWTDRVGALLLLVGRTYSKKKKLKKVWWTIVILGDAVTFRFYCLFHFSLFGRLWFGHGSFL